MTGNDVEIAKAKAKAKELAIAEQLDRNLWRAAQTVRHYGAWSKRPDFDELWNIGVSNVSESREEIDFGWTKQDFEIVNFDAFNQRFSLAAAHVSTPTPDDYYSYWSLLYRYNGKTVALIDYSDGDDLPDFCPGLSDVEEFHFDKNAFSAIAQLNRMIDAYKEKSDRKEAEERKERYSGKITF
jgi:hypothetical protein